MLQEAKADILWRRALGGKADKLDADRLRRFEPDLPVRPGGGHVHVAEPLAEGAYRAENIRVRVGRNEGRAGPREAVLDRHVSAYALVYVADPDAPLAGEEAALLLVRGVKLVGTGGVAVKSEDRARRVGHFKAVVKEILDDVRAAEVPGRASVEKDVGDLPGLGLRFSVS